MRLSRWASATYNLFCWFHRVKGRIFPSLRKISAMLGCSERTVKRATAELVRLGMLWKTRRYRRSTEYSLTAPEGAQMAFEFAGAHMSVCGEGAGNLGAENPGPERAAPAGVNRPAPAYGSAGLGHHPGSDRFEPRPLGSNPGRCPTPCPHLGPTVVKPSLRLVRREISVPLVIFLKPVHARKPPRRQTALERASEKFLREG